MAGEERRASVVGAVVGSVVGGPAAERRKRGRAATAVRGAGRVEKWRWCDGREPGSHADDCESEVEDFGVIF